MLSSISSWRVAPRGGARIETRTTGSTPGGSSSRPAGARGLKRLLEVRSKANCASRPAGARGLKLSRGAIVENERPVAPRGGARIETGVDGAPAAGPAASRPAGARGLKPSANIFTGGARWSRPAGARGLKLYPGGARRLPLPSRPAGARGLKRPLYRLLSAPPLVAPRGGARIETAHGGGGRGG